jgi:GxxExxY protein
MHKHYTLADKWTKQVISAAIEVHRHKGPGLLEEIYEKCLMREFELRGIPAANQVRVSLEYKGVTFDQELRLDAIIDHCLIVELKAVECVLPVHKAQLLSYMKLMDAPVGLIINFHARLLKEGISRMVLRGADHEDVDS